MEGLYMALFTIPSAAAVGFSGGLEGAKGGKTERGF